MADRLISPEAYTTPGGVPRRLLAGVFVVVSGLAMLTFWLSTPDEPLMTGDQKARSELQKPGAVLAQAKGNPHWVDELAEASVTPPAVPPGALSTSLAPSSGMDPAAGRMPLPVLAPQGPVGGTFPDPSVPDAADVERERAARSASATVFDEGAESGQGARDGAASRRDIDAPSAAAPGRLASGDMLGPLADVIKSVHGTPVAPRPAEADRQWGRNQVPQAGAMPLRARAPASNAMLQQGTVIPCVLTRRINSDLPGVVTARVAMDVYDSRTSRRRLLPKGATLVGAYNNDVRAGQSRLQFAFTRLVMPDGSTFDLPGATGSDAAGQAGIGGDVDRHFFRSFGAALLLGVLADRVTRIDALPNGGSDGQGGLSATGQVFVDTARAELERHKSVPPTVTVEAGARIHVEVVRDMVFDAVEGVLP